MTASVIREMPKVELHAHLSGSIREETIDELLQEKGLAGLQCRVNGGLAGGVAKDRMQGAFKLFDAIYKVTDSLAVMKRISKEVVLDYAAENTKYLELRTSLKSLEGRSEDEYLEAVIQGIEEANHELPEDDRVMTKLLVSLNRSKPEMAAASIDVALRFANRGVVGIDLSGNCYSNKWQDFVPHLDRARTAGLPATVHAGEKDDRVELREMLEWHPGRIGHLVFSDPECDALIREKRIPIEMCLTSNLFTSDWDMTDHHVTEWLNHPISINTDDRGVFNCSLTSEFQLLQAHAPLTDEGIFNLSEGALHQSFLPKEDQKPVQRCFDLFRTERFATEK